MFRLIRKIFTKFDKSVCYCRGLMMFGKLIYVEKNITVKGYENIEIGTKCKIFQGSIIDASSGNIVFNSNVTICVNSIINSAGGFIQIDSGTTIGDFCNLYGQDGTTIGKNSVIAAGSIVNKNVPDYSVAVGVPAHIVKQYDFEKQEWFND